MKITFNGVTIVDTENRPRCSLITVSPMQHKKRWSVVCRDAGGNQIGGADAVPSREAGIRTAVALKTAFDERQVGEPVEVRVKGEPLWS